MADVDIANMALSHIGVGKTLEDLDTDTGEEVDAVNLFLTKARKQMLRSHDWAFATKTAELDDQTEDPDDEWDYSYRYPSDCVKARRIFSGDRIPIPGSQLAFKITNNTTTTTISAATAASPVVLTLASTSHLFDGDQIIISAVAGMTELNGNTYTVASKTDTTIALSGVNGTAYTAYTSGGTVTLTSYSALAVYTDEDDAVLEYTFLATDTTFYPADFEFALSYLLAFYIAPRLSKGDLFGLQQRMMQLYRESVELALVNETQEKRKDPPADAEFIRDR